LIARRAAVLDGAKTIAKRARGFVAGNFAALSLQMSFASAEGIC
jgi:hypothetical protein